MRTLVLALVAVSFVGCDLRYPLSLNGNDKYEIDLPSGKLVVSAFRGPESVYVQLNFKDLDKIVVLKKRGVEILQGTAKMGDDIWNVNGKIISTDEYQVAKGDVVIINFKPTIGLRKGDTLSINADGFMTIDGSPVSFPTLSVGLERLPLR